MFSGIIQSVGEVTAQEHKNGSMWVWLNPHLNKNAKLIPGGSIGVDGVCLTVERVKKGQVHLEVMSETLKKTTLGTLTIGSYVNIESPVRVGESLDGHLVMGHVDTITKVIAKEKEGGNTIVTMKIPATLRQYIVPRGSIAVAGIGFTIASHTKTTFSVVCTEYTLLHTTLGNVQVGDMLNIEVDLIGKYMYSFYISRHSS